VIYFPFLVVEDEFPERREGVLGAFEVSETVMLRPTRGRYSIKVRSSRATELFKKSANSSSVGLGAPVGN
jgi:hypothetical protein